MKYQAMTSGLRVTFSKTELRVLLNLARFGRDRLDGSGYYLTPREQEYADLIIMNLDLGREAVRYKQAEAKARREAPKREEERRRAREHSATIDGWSVGGMLGDWADISEDPDHQRWADMFHPDFVPREQGEIRRNAWRCFIWRGRVSEDTSEYLPTICTMTADRAEIEPLVRAAIAAAQGNA